MTECAEETREFLVESHESLNALDRKLVELEKDPLDAQGMAAVLRTIHSLKGTSDFLGFHVISSIAHLLEGLLVQVREKIRPLSPALISVILESLDAVKLMLTAIERTSQEGADSFVSLRERLSRVCQEGAGGSAAESAAKVFCAGNSQTSVEEPKAWSEKALERRAFRAADLPGQEAAPRSDMQLFEGTRASDRAANSTVRVDVFLLDKMLKLVEELMATGNPEPQHDLQVPGARGGSETAGSITQQLRDCLILARMQPVAVIWNKFPRAVRDVAAEMGKMIDVQMDGALIELDRTIIEAIRDPFTHLVRNACDHGIESSQVRIAKGKTPQGTISLRAVVEEGSVILQILDDGAGIDVNRVKTKALQKGLIQLEQADSMSDQEAMQLIFLPGLSTAETVSSVSGRGVGMDVVKTNIEVIRGAVDVSSIVDKGTTITITIPARLP